MKPTERRGKAAGENLRATVFGIFLNFLYSFVSRRVLVYSMGKEYVGLGSLVGNMAVLLTLLDFGASSAVIFRLYKPLADGDKRAVSDIFNYSRDFFGKLSYVYMGLVLMLAVLAKVIIRTE